MYTNNCAGGSVGGPGGFTINGSVISKDEAMVVGNGFGRMTMNYDTRIKESAGRVRTPSSTSSCHGRRISGEVFRPLRQCAPRHTAAGAPQTTGSDGALFRNTRTKGTAMLHFDRTNRLIFASLLLTAVVTSLPDAARASATQAAAAANHGRLTARDEGAVQRARAAQFSKGDSFSGLHGFIRS